MRVTPEMVEAAGKATRWTASRAQLYAAIEAVLQIVERTVHTTDDLIEELQKGIPESWDGEGSPESIVVDYVRELERRLQTLGSSLERWSDDADATPERDSDDRPTRDVDAG